LCICPHCDTLQRISDLQIRYAGKTGTTWLDDFQSKESRLQKKEEAFEEKKVQLKQQSRERGRRQVPLILKDLLHSELTTQPFDPYDIKAILHPVDFVVFDGMNAREKIDEIAFLSRKPDSRVLSEIKGSIKTSIRRGNYDWQVARVDVNGNVTYTSK
jgi:predicted Holliday junction resolvase-like endonuclease